MPEEFIGRLVIIMLGILLAIAFDKVIKMTRTPKEVKMEEIQQRIMDVIKASHYHIEERCVNTPPEVPRGSSVYFECEGEIVRDGIEPEANLLGTRYGYQRRYYPPLAPANNCCGTSRDEPKPKGSCVSSNMRRR